MTYVDNVGVSLVLLYIFVVLAIVLPLCTIPLGIAISYDKALGIFTVPISYVFNFITLMVFLSILGFVLYRFRYLILKPLIKNALSLCPRRGVTAILSCGGFAWLTLSLIIVIVIVYLINSDMILIPGYNYVPPITRIMGFQGSGLLTWSLGLINSVLSVLVVILTVYQRFRALSRNVVSRLGGSLSGALGITASVGSAATAATACSMGACTVSTSGVSPLMAIIAYILGLSDTVLTNYALVTEIVILLALSLIIYYIHRSAWS